MNDKPDLITFNVSSDFEHFAAIHSPYPGPTSDHAAKYSMVLPACNVPADCRFKQRNDVMTVTASSTKQPFIYVEPKFQTAWEILKHDADVWRFPIDRLLRGRPMTAAVQPFHVNPRVSYGKPFIALELVAVHVMGDFDKSEPLKEHIEWIKDGLSLGN